MHAKKEINKILSFVTKLQVVIATKDNQIESIKEKIDDLEQYTTTKNIIITGLKTCHRTDARAYTPLDNYAQNNNAPEEAQNR